MKLLLSTGAWIGIALGIVAVIALFIVIWGVSTHNKLVSLKIRTDEAFSTIDVSLKKRFDLIPNVVNTVKGYAKHESETLLQVVEARMGATTTEEKINADNALSQAVQGLNVLVERYPDLKANTNFISLQGQLANIENELSQARRYFNGTIREYNTKIQIFPSSIIAKMMHLAPLPMFEIVDAVQRENVTVEF